MGLNTDIKPIIERALSLRDRLDFEIESGTNLCRFCTENGHLYCQIAYQNTAFSRSQSLVAIRDSLKDVENNLLFLQKLQSGQAVERLNALDRLEESRSVLIELVRSFKGAITPGVLRDLNACFGNQNDVVVRDAREKVERSGRGEEKKRWSVFATAKKVWGSWKWRRAFGVAVKIVITSVMVACWRRKLDSRESEMRETLLTISTNPLHVFQARG